MLSETKWWKIHENMPKIATGNREIFQKHQKNIMKKSKIKNRTRQFDKKKHVEVPKIYSK